MNQIIKKAAHTIAAVAITFSITISFLSFTVQRMEADFLVQLGITKAEADKKITASILGGFLDAYGIKSAKNLATNDKIGIAKDLLGYTKKQLSSAAFLKSYQDERSQRKPVMREIEKPEETNKKTVEQYKESIKNIEGMIASTNDPSTKKTFEDLLKQSKASLADAQNPNSKINQILKESYQQQVVSAKQDYDRDMTEWNNQYPANEKLFIKRRLTQFLEETKEIDFSAELIEKNGKKYFKNSAYESKGKRWKMAFRAGKEVVENTRQFVEQWIAELK